MMPITFQTSMIAVAQILAMGVLGFYLVRRGTMDTSGLKLLSFLSVNVFFPLFIFYQIVEHFDVTHLSFWWAFPLINIALILMGLCLAFLVTVCRQTAFKDEFLAVSSMHNAGYIPLLIIMSLPLGAWAEHIYPCVILSVIGFDTCLWSLGVWLLTRKMSAVGKSKDLGGHWRRMINPPLVSMSAAIVIVLVFGPKAVPETFLKPIKILGDAAMASAMLVIGGNLSLSYLTRKVWAPVTGVVLIKLIFLPLITLGIVCALKLNPLISFVAIIQASMPTAITLSIIGRNYGTKHQDFVNQSIFVTHIVSVITIPFFLGLYGRLMG